MLFEYKTRTGVRSPVTDAATFQVNVLTRLKTSDARAIDLSHVIDPSYEYHSRRELQWHLADRLGLAPATVALREAN